MKNLFKLSSLFFCISMLFSCSVEDVNKEEELALVSSNSSAVVVDGNIYYLKGNNGRYVSHNNSTKDMKCDRTSPNAWEQFYLRQGSTGFWYLKGVSNDRYVSMENGVKDMICNRTSVGAWEKFDIEYQGSANGNDIVAFKSRQNNRYVSSENGAKDMICNRTSIGAWEKFELVPVGGNPPPPTNTGSAAQILGGLANWKLNAYSGNLNVSSSDNGLNYVDSASKSDNDDWFYANNGYAYFKCYPGNPTSGGSSNPRTELREMNGSSEMYWDGDSNTEHSMKWRFRIDNLPPSGKLCFGQIHERDDDYDDIIRVQCQGSAGQSSGSIDLRILGYVTEELEGEGRTIDFNFNMDTEYYFELTMQNGVVRLYNLSSTGGRIQELYESADVGNADENYFKAGCYLQSTSSSDSGSSTYGLVGIKTLIVR